MVDTPTLITFGAQVAIFLVLWALMSRLVFRPVLALLAERRARTEGAMAEAQAARREIERLRAEEKAGLDEARAAAQRELEQLRRAAEAEGQEVIEKARAESERILAEARERVAAGAAEARRTLARDVEEIARRVVDKILGGERE